MIPYFMRKTSVSLLKNVPPKFPCILGTLTGRHSTQTRTNTLLIAGSVLWTGRNRGRLFHTALNTVYLNMQFEMVTWRRATCPYFSPWTSLVILNNRFIYMHTIRTTSTRNEIRYTSIQLTESVLTPRPLTLGHIIRIKWPTQGLQAWHHAY